MVMHFTYQGLRCCIMNTRGSSSLLTTQVKVCHLRFYYVILMLHKLCKLYRSTVVKTNLSISSGASRK